APHSLRLVARVVVAGFGPFSIWGGFGLDRQALEALHEDEHSARVRVIALGVLEWAVLAPIAWVTAVVFLAQGANIMPSLLWPWAIGVPVGLGFAFWASAPHRIARLERLGGRRREWACHVLEGVGILRKLITEPRKWVSALLGTALYWVRLPLAPALAAVVAYRAFN